MIGLDDVLASVGRMAAARQPSRGETMSGMTPASKTNKLDKGTVMYEDVRVVISPEGPFHYEVTVSPADGDRVDHAVEHVAINSTTVRFDDPIWFIGVDLDVGIPIEQTGETAWVWP